MVQFLWYYLLFNVEVISEFLLHTLISARHTSTSKVNQLCDCLYFKNVILEITIFIFTICVALIES